MNDYQEIERKESEEIHSALSKILKTYYFLPKPKPYRHTFLDIIQKSNNENLISDYIVFLLNPSINGVGDSPIKSVISFTHPDADIGLSDFTDAEIIREHRFDDFKRIDIIIRCKNEKVILAIENKIYSHERAKQTYNYQKQVESEFDGYAIYFIFLAPYPKEKLSSEKFAWLTYKELYSLLTKITVDTFSEFDHLKFYQDFLLHIKNNFMDSIEELKFSEKTKLYLEHKKIIDDIVNSYRQDGEKMQTFAKQIAEGLFSEKWGETRSLGGNSFWQLICKPMWYTSNILAHFEWWWYMTGNNILESKEMAFMFEIEGKKDKEMLSEIELDESLKKMAIKSGAEYRPKNRKNAIYFRRINLPNSIIELKPKEIKEILLNEMMRFADSGISDSIDQIITKYR